MTTRADIEQWLERRNDNHTHMLVVVDTFDYDDFPVFVSKEQDVNQVVDSFRKKEMTRVMEVYNLNMDLQKQLGERFCFNL